MENVIFYAGYGDLWRDVRALAVRLPKADAVIGAPRSGLLPATMLATMLHLPLVNADESTGNVVIEAGNRVERREIKTALVVEDACYYGSFRDRCRGVRDWRLVYACIYGGPETWKRIEFVGRVAERPRVFAWNLLNCALAGSFCVDIDGVLCRDPAESENDDGPIYRRFIASAEPLFRARFPLAAVVTSRLEKYRGETEAWLRRNGIEFGKLVMAPYATKAERKAANRYAADKADYFAATACHAFIESDDRTARRIAELTGRPVICPTSDAGYNTRS